MNEYYCHKCSSELGHLFTGSSEHINFTGSTYQLDKFIKHTLPPSQSGLVSIFSDSSYNTYKNYAVSTLASGSTEFDHFNRKNIIWYAARENGISFLNGVPQSSTDVVKVVLPHSDDKIHCYPIKLSDLAIRNCKRCGIDILTGATSQHS